MIAICDIYILQQTFLASPVVIVLMFVTLDTYNVFNDLCFPIPMSVAFNNHNSLLLL